MRDLELMAAYFRCAADNRKAQMTPLLPTMNIYFTRLKYIL